MGKKRDHSERESKVILELRKEIKKLKVENQQLRKRVRLLEPHVYADSHEDQEAQPTAQKSKKEYTYQCPKCGTYTDNFFTLKSQRYYRCENCNSRGKIKD